MKTFYLAAVAASVMSVAVAQVSPEEHAAHHPDQAATTAKTDTPSKKSTPSTKAPSGDQAAVEADMQTRMKSMQELMDKFAQAKDPAERARLLAQHQQMMHEQLGAMMHMGCAKGEGGGKMAGSDSEPQGKDGKGMAGKEGGGMMAHGGMMAGGMMNGDMMKCHELMRARMDIMVGMMDQMMRHEEAAQAAK